MAPHAALWVSLIVGAMSVRRLARRRFSSSRRSLEPVFAATALAAFACAAWAFGELSIVYDRFDVLLLGTWFWCCRVRRRLRARFDAAGEPRCPPAHGSRAPSTLPPDRGTAAVILLGDVDPDEYDERWTAADLEKLSDEGLLHVSIAILPFLFFAQKARYRAVGGSSPAARQLEWLAERVGDSVRGKPHRPRRDRLARWRARSRCASAAPRREGLSHDLDRPRS